ncbi:hypothetical protein V6N12_022465 [Hibiscus sabdariffa]|uniref:RNase H type-1 domain-containing protein n=1 Tax=Hibiscus sabdariffa TaxID=183260 RepID=A0ABR2FUS7_9ROSI
MLADVCTPNKMIPCSSVLWNPPPFSWLKFNVDGAMRLDGSAGGIGGVLKDASGISLMSFSIPTGPGSPALVEILAIDYAIKSFIESEWIEKYKLIVESDCSNAVDLILNLLKSPPSFTSLVKGLSIKLF